MLTIWDWVAGIAAVLVFIGSFLPWATVAGIFSVSGTSGDGVITLILAIASLVMLAVAVRTDVELRHAKWLRSGVLLAGLAVAIIALVDTVDVASAEFASPGGGLILVLLAGVAQTVAAGVVTYQKWSPQGFGPATESAAGVVASKDTSSEVVEPMPAVASAEKPSEQTNTASDPLTDDVVQGGSRGESLRGEAPSPGPQAMAIDGRLLVKAGGAIMAVSTLFSWLKVGSDGFPNVAGVGSTTTGTGLAVFVLGLSLLLREWPVGVTLGKALGAFSITLVYLSMVGTSSGELGAGVWIGIAGTAAAVLGSVMVAGEAASQSALALTRPPYAGVGAVLAIIASFWLDWVYLPGLGFNLATGQVRDGLGGVEALNGLDPDVPFGIPVLILAALALILVADARWSFLAGRKRHHLLAAQVAGIAIAVIAGANVLGMLMLGFFVFGSGPLVALAGGTLLTTSIRRN